MSAPDKAGLDAIADYTAKRLPYLWEYGKGQTQLSDIETDVRRFVQAKDGAGQTALAVHKLETWLGRLKGKTIDSLAVELDTKERFEGADRFIDRMLKKEFPAAKTSVVTHKTGFGVGKQIFTQEFDIPWEVDAFWKAFRADALPKLGPIEQGARGAAGERVAGDARQAGEPDHARALPREVFPPARWKCRC